MIFQLPLLLHAITFVDDIAQALNEALNSAGPNVSNISSWKATVSLARTNVSNTQSALTTAQSSYTTAASAYTIAKQQVSDPSSTNVSVAQASIDQAQANYEKALADYNKNLIRAPFDGVVTRMDAKIGQTINAGMPLVSLISKGNYQIEGYVSEADIASIKFGQPVSVTLDAYGNNAVFPAHVLSSDLSETMTNGVGSYKVVIQFDNADNKIKSGMTANASIVTSSKNDVVAVPDSAIINHNNSTFVLMTSSKTEKPHLQEVSVGISGDGWSEITSGLNAGDLIATVK